MQNLDGCIADRILEHHIAEAYREAAGRSLARQLPAGQPRWWSRQRRHLAQGLSHLLLAAARWLEGYTQLPTQCLDEGVSRSFSR